MLLSSDSGNRAIQRIDHVAPPGLEQRQSVQCQRVEKATAAGAPPGFEVGDHPNRFALTGRRDGDAQHVAQRVRLIGGHHQHPLPGARITDRGRGRQGGFSYPTLADEETDPGRGGRSGLTQPRLVSSDPSTRCRSTGARPFA